MTDVIYYYLFNLLFIYLWINVVLKLGRIYSISTCLEKVLFFTYKVLFLKSVTLSINLKPKLLFSFSKTMHIL